MIAKNPSSSRTRADGLIELLPRRQIALTTRGRVLLDAANGECACPPEDV